MCWCLVVWSTEYRRENKCLTDVQKNLAEEIKIDWKSQLNHTVVCKLITNKRKMTTDLKLKSEGTKIPETNKRHKLNFKLKFAIWTKRLSSYIGIEQSMHQLGH